MAKAIRITSKALRWSINAKRLKLENVRGRMRTPTAKIEKKGKFKQGWKEIDGKRIFFRSLWEANFGSYLQWQKERGMIKEWEHEPKTFWFEGIKRGCVTYLPDFKVIANDGSHEWIEVKGRMDPKSRTKINRFRKFFPEEKLRVVDSDWYKSNKKNLSLIVPGWE